MRDSYDDIYGPYLDGGESTDDQEAYDAYWDNLIERYEGGSTTVVKSAKPSIPEPPEDDQGNLVTREDIDEGFKTLHDARMNIDADVQKVEDIEAQAKAVRKLNKAYDDMESRLKRWSRELERFEVYDLGTQGARDFKMSDIEGNRALTEMVDERAEWFHTEVDKLKEKLAEDVRQRLDEMEAEGIEITVANRDALYQDLVKAEIIEEWEPVEL